MEATSSSLTCFIGELPDELLLNTVVQLRIERGFLAEQEAERQRCCDNAIIVRSLHALTLSCRKFHAIASPFLYQNVIRTHKELFMPLFFRTLLHKPSLGRHVRYIEFATFEDRKIGYFKSDHDLYVERLAQVQWPGLLPMLDSGLDLTHGVAAISNQDTVRLLGGRRIRSQELAAACSSRALLVMLSMMENLEDAALPDCRTILCTLTITTGRLKGLWLLSGGNVSPGSTPPRVYALRFISSNGSDGQRHLSHYLRRFCMLKADWVKLGPLPAMKEISLTVLDVDFVDIDDHLEDCASLERFSCRWQWTDSFIPHKTVNLPNLRRSLQRVRETLTHLTVDTSESASLVDLDRSIPPLGSLRSFGALKYLDVAGLVLWGDDDLAEPLPLSSLLPESLEVLVIKVEWDDDIEDALHELSFDCAASLPNLKSIECTWRPVPRLIADYLTKAFQSAAVDLVLAVEDAQVLS